MTILGIETSCDETACAVLKKDQDGIHILSNVVASSAQLQAKYGGVIPEQAAREQLRSVIPVIQETLRQAGLLRHPRSNPRLRGDRSINIDSRLRGNDRGKRGDDRVEIDAIAVTYGPGLIGSLLVGVETAKVLAKVWDKPLIPVNHLLGHFYANWIDSPVIPLNKGIQLEKSRSELDPRLPANASVALPAGKPSAMPMAARQAGLRGDDRGKRGDDNREIPKFPCLGLLVSGGHTDLVLFTGHGEYEYLGGTRDDAAGECFDKCARLLGLPYPGGPAIAAEAAKCKVQSAKCKVELPSPLINEKTFDFSFSGLKTAVLREVERLKANQKFNNSTIQQLAYGVQEAITHVLVDKTIKASQKYKVEQIMIAGGVAANQVLVRKCKVQSAKCKIKLHVPPPDLCTDNGAMIAAAGFFQKPIPDPLSLQADPGLSLEERD